MSTRRPDDCIHRNTLAGTTVERCVDCGQAWRIYASSAEAIADIRAVLARTRVVIDEEDPA